MTHVVQIIPGVYLEVNSVITSQPFNEYAASGGTSVLVQYQVYI